MIKKFIIFIKDIFNQRNNKYYINSNSSYQIFRFLDRVSRGLSTKFIEIFVTKKNSKETYSSYKILNNVPIHDLLNIKNEIDQMRVFKHSDIKKIHNTNIILKTEDFSYRFKDSEKNNAIRLDILKADLLSNLKISKFVTQRKWLDTVEENFNFSPKLIDVNAWYTLPEKKKSDDIYVNEEITGYDAQIWHRDVDKLRDIKIFTYLTDVENEENGPFEILDNTHLFKLNKFKYLNKNNYRILDRNIPLHLKKNKHAFLGKKGTSFVVNTRCLHRGTKVNKEFRLILELYFSSSFFGKHMKFNDFTRPKLSKNWESFNFWNEIIENKPENYKYLFLSKN